jgi:hypothetical protein
MRSNLNCSILLAAFFLMIGGAYAGGKVAIPKTGQTSSYATGDDGALQKGVASPAPRFTDNGNGSITDNLTGLIWLKDANCIQTQYSSFDADETVGDGMVAWQHALDFVSGINSGTYSNCGGGDTDWRLPSVTELKSLVDISKSSPALPTGHLFSNVQSNRYWSSTTYAPVTMSAWYVNMVGGIVNRIDKANSYSVWTVRGGQ